MKKIFNIFALSAAVLAFSAAMASCQKETATPQTPAVRVIHVDLDATVAETKATYAEKVVTIQDDDQLYITLTGAGNSWTATGTLTYASSSFSGEVTVKTGSYSGSDPITDAKDLTATFLPNGYSTVGYLSAEGVATAANAFYAGAKSVAVPQLVHLTATVSDKAGVVKTPLTLSAQNSVLCYSINANKLSAGAHTVSVSDGTTTISGSVTAVADAATTFAFAFPANATAKDYTLSISGYNNVVKSGKTLTAGKVVNITTDVTVNSNAPLSGVFTVDAGKTVKFSKGNLQATTTDLGTTWSWGFAANQWDYIGNAAANTSINGNGTVSANGTVDLFGWSTSATRLGINNSNSNTSYNGDFADWGSNATVQAGIGSGWRTLTSAEWTYLLNSRTSVTTRYCKATVNSKGGLVIFPDSYSHPTGVTAVASANTANANFTTNSWSGENWTKMEEAGAIFLPAAGYRYGTSVSAGASSGYYWSSTPYGASKAYYLCFDSSLVLPAHSNYRFYGYSVRLVQDQ